MLLARSGVAFMLVNSLQVQLATNDHRVGLARQLVDLLKADCVDLVVDIYRLGTGMSATERSHRVIQHT
jgi:hypothetical protein